MKIYYYIILTFVFFSNLSIADTKKPNNKIEQEKEVNSIEEFFNYLDAPNEKMEKKFDKISENQLLIKTKDVMSYVFTGENPAFQDKKHMISLTYGGNIGGAGSNVHYFSGRYSVPVFLFMNSRASIEMGGIVGNSSYINQNNSVNQFIAGVMYEGILNFKYFYVTGGFGPYIRTANSVSVPGDSIGSNFVFGEKIAIGRTFFNRYNLELVYRHFSNGNLALPNAGYNFIGIEAAIRF